ncbi:MAG TPA: phosphotransferase [Actinomycetes bacterium]
MTTDRDTSLPRWRDPAWRAEVDAWVADRLAGSGLRQTGEVDRERRYPWSAVWRIPTDGGPVWFKANAAGMAHEAPLYAVLVRRAPTHVLAPLALDPARGWLLLPDGGATLRDIEGARTDLGAWERMLQEYAEMQRNLEPYVDELLAAGVPDRGPEHLPRVRAALLDDPDLLLLGDEHGLTAEQRDELLGEQSAYAALCAELAAYGIAPSLQHDDLHDHNVFVSPEPGGPLRVFDWGDAVVGQPFGVLLVSLRVVSDLIGAANGSAELLRLRDAYLEPWTTDRDIADLREAARLAVRVGGVSRADCYRRATMEWPDRRRPFGEGVPGWLLEQRGPMPLEPMSARPRT